MKIVTHPDRCIASGACVLTNPDVFAQDDDGIVVALTIHPSAEAESSVREAVRSCPAMAIELIAE
jgi:ferredoxin